MGLTKTAITRPVFILMLMVAAVLLGTMAYMGMAKELNPPVNFGTVTISTTYPGADPDAVNTLVSRKIEDAISGVSGMREVTSTSEEGQSIVVASLNLDVDTDVALNDIRSKVDAIASQLPKEVDKPTITKLDMSATPVLYLSLSATGLNSQQLRDLVDNHLKDRFAQIEGVTDVEVQGGDVREIHVQLRKDKLLQYGVGISDIQSAVQNANVNTPSGKIVQGNEELSVRVPAEFSTVGQIADMRFTVTDPDNPNAKGKLVRLGDVASVVDTIQERTAYSRLNGRDTIAITLQKTREGNAVQIVSDANLAIQQMEKEYQNVGLKFTTTMDQAKQITDSLDDMNFALFFGIFLVALIVYIFLHNFRGMLIVALALPTCIFCTFIALKGAGFTINNLSMLALSLAIGVLVDDAIVVLENISRHLKMGEDPRDAAMNGRSEIGLAAIAITMADVVVFLPMAFVSGIVGQFFRPLALSYVFAVLFSLFVSFTLTPMLASRWYRAGENLEDPKGGFAKWFEKNFARFEHGYGRGLEWGLQHRWFVFILGNSVLLAVFMAIFGGGMPNAKAAFMVGFGLTKVAFFIGIIVFVANLFRRVVKPRILLNALLFGLIFPAAALVGFAAQQWKGEPIFKFQFFPANDQGSVSVNIELPPGSNLEATQRVVTTVENRIAGHPDVKYVLSNVGTQGVGSFSAGNQGSNYAQVSASLYDKEALLDRIEFWKKQTEHLRNKTSDEVAADLTQRIGRVPGATIKVAASSGFGGSAIDFGLHGDDRDVLIATAQKIKQGLQNGAVKGVINPDLSSKPGTPELRVVPDRTRLADMGLTVNDLANTLRILYTGDDTPKFRVNGQEYTIRTMLDLQDRNDPNVLTEVPVKFESGTPIFVTSAATIEPGTNVQKITRRDRQEEVEMTADLLPGVAQGSAQAQVMTWIQQQHLIPDGVTVVPLGQTQSQGREGPGLIIAFFTGLVLVYMLLASLYDNLLYPFIIQLAQPQAFVGALLALMITNQPANMVGFIGLIALIGLVGKNAILLVDYTNTLRDRGRNRHDALVEAGPTRLRPILMTTLALLLGMMPVALALGRGSEFRQTIGIVVIGGMSLSTLLTLFVIPCSYTIFDDLSLWIGRLLGPRPKDGGSGAAELTTGTAETEGAPAAAG